MWRVLCNFAFFSGKCVIGISYVHRTYSSSISGCCFLRMISKSVVGLTLFVELTFSLGGLQIAKSVPHSVAWSSDGCFWCTLQLQRDVKIDKLSQDSYVEQTLEILAALRKLGDTLQPDEEAFLASHATDSLRLFEKVDQEQLGMTYDF